MTVQVSMYGNQGFSPEIYRQEAYKVRQLYMEQILAGVACNSKCANNLRRWLGLCDVEI